MALTSSERQQWLDRIRAGNVRPLGSWHRRCFPATLYWHDDILAADTSPPSARYFLKEPESKGVYPCVGYGGAVLH